MSILIVWAVPSAGIAEPWCSPQFYVNKNKQSKKKKEMKDYKVISGIKSLAAKCRNAVDKASEKLSNYEHKLMCKRICQLNKELAELRKEVAEKNQDPIISDIPVV